ncbi:hypothetical protein [Gorillibacterium timonense]|uniref:hypothetical protein n=1 Tax=Gorillibacterium timonense TaxID=1689269 RepID=UPI00071D8F0E|nr:hypothetical protein [Gorillibacterium timonense]
MKNKPNKDLQKECLDIINQNEFINSKFDSSGLLFQQNREYVTKTISTAIPIELLNHYDRQLSYNGYLFSLLEEIHRFSYLALSGVFMFEERLKHKQDDTFFSSRYFLNNSFLHVMGAWERTFRLSAFIHGYDFSKNSGKSSAVYRALKKVETFQKSRVSSLIEDLKARGYFPTIEDFRESNDHRLSKHVEYSQDDDMKKVAWSCYENAATLYKVIMILLEQLSSQSFIYNDLINLNILNWDARLDLKKINETVPIELQKQLLDSRLEQNQNYITKAISTFEALRPKLNKYLTKLDEHATRIKSGHRLTDCG